MVPTDFKLEVHEGRNGNWSRVPNIPWKGNHCIVRSLGSVSVPVSHPSLITAASVVSRADRRPDGQTSGQSSR